MGGDTVFVVSCRHENKQTCHARGRPETGQVIPTFRFRGGAGLMFVFVIAVNQTGRLNVTTFCETWLQINVWRESERERERESLWRFQILWEPAIGRLARRD